MNDLGTLIGSVIVIWLVMLGLLLAVIAIAATWWLTQ